MWLVAATLEDAALTHGKLKIFISKVGVWLSDRAMPGICEALGSTPSTVRKKKFIFLYS
jgi:hypothetical protein